MLAAGQLAKMVAMANPHGRALVDAGGGVLV
jgi:hypothetical protein